MNLKHFALYCKGHYISTNNIWDDIKKCIEADGYTPADKYDCVEIIINNISPLVINQIGISYYTRNLLSGISPEECWKVGYYTKDHKFSYGNANYDYKTAILYYFMSATRFLTLEQCGGLPKADRKVLKIKVNKKKYKKEHMYK